MAEKKARKREIEKVEREDWIPLMLRVPPDLMEFLKQEAAEEYRSLNSQILAIVALRKRQKEALNHPGIVVH